MRKVLFFALVTVTALTLGGVAAAQTSGAHFTKGGTPVCTDIGTQLRCTAEVAGLGGETVVSTVSANGTATGLTCTSPGGNEAPGQNPAVPVTAGGSQTINNPKNGRASVDVTTATPTVTPKQAGCPNNNWRVTIADVTFTTYTLTISQGGVTLFSCSGSFSPSPSQNGQTSAPTC
ncbi:MAG TPA: hypothetical protein VE596_11330 [Gaiellaceae bacterium]|nr:hypothetical protein [Gaiellaceae bacterium]